MSKRLLPLAHSSDPMESASVCLTRKEDQQMLSETASGMPPQERVVVLGASLFAEEVADLISEVDHQELVGFVEGVDRARCNAALLELPVIWIDDVPKLDHAHRSVCAVGTPKRKRFVEQAIAHGLRFTTVVHPTAHVSPTTTLGSGAIIGAGAIVAAHSRVGQHVILNRGCMIGHHVTLGDYVTVSPGANIAGKVKIGDGTYVAMGAIVLDGVSIGRDVVVGAGAVVTRDVPDAVQVVGVPARVVKHLVP